MTNFTPDDTPISKEDQDELQVKPRIVNKILKLLENEQISALTLAVTGEWGVGKSSAMNLLSNELNNPAKNVIVRFEPLLEGRFEVIEILELFYLKLYASLHKKGFKKVKPIIVDILSSLGSLAFDGTKLSVGIPKVGSAELNLEKKYNKLLKIWRKKNPKSFSEQTEELNKFLCKKNIKLFIFIDEVDRLPSNHTINFLLFARILETFKNLICIVGIDYEQVVKSLKTSKAHDISTYDQARAYLDKLFHARFHIHHNESALISYATEKLKSIDNKSFNSVITSDSYEMQSAFSSVIGYLKTPRQIKKWLTSLTMNKPLIDYYRKDLIEILMLSAVCVKHPLILNNFARYTLPMLSLPGFLEHHLKSRYGIDFLYKEENRNKKNEVILQSTGVKKSGNEEVHLELPIQYIVDPAAHKMLKEVLNPAKLSWLSLFIDGYVDDNKVKIYHEYLEGDVNEAIKWMIEHSEEADIIAADLRDTILKQQILPKKIANLDVLNKLWQKTTSPGDIGNPYKALFFPIYKHPAEDMLKNASLSLLESYLHDVLSVFGIKNKAPQRYDLSQFSPDEFQHGAWRNEKRAISEITYNQISISDFTQSTIKELLKAWISRVESDFSNDFDSVIQNENHLIGVFYRYIQWAKAAGLSSDKRKSLTQYVQNYLDSQEVGFTKKLKLANTIFRECATLDKLTEDNNAMINLFNKDAGLIKVLEDIAKKANPSDTPCYKHFKACIDNT